MFGIHPSEVTLIGGALVLTGFLWERKRRRGSTVVFGVGCTALALAILPLWFIRPLIRPGAWIGVVNESGAAVTDVRLVFDGIEIRPDLSDDWGGFEHVIMPTLGFERVIIPTPGSTVSLAFRDAEGELHQARAEVDGCWFGIEDIVIREGGAVDWGEVFASD